MASELGVLEMTYHSCPCHPAGTNHDKKTKGDDKVDVEFHFLK
jgi:hypothetical protein